MPSNTSQVDLCYKQSNKIRTILFLSAAKRPTKKFPLLLATMLLALPLDISNNGKIWIKAKACSRHHTQSSLSHNKKGMSKYSA